MLDGTWFFECGCGADEHTLRFIYDKECNELYVSIFLNHWQRWYKRWWVAVKYTLGYKCKYGHWDTWMLKEKDVDKMQEMLNQFKEGLKEGLKENNNG